MDMAEIKIEENRMYVEKEGRQAGEMTFYHDNDSNIVIDHTEVAEDWSGQGIGKELIANIVEKARAENKQIIPKCSFAEKQLKKHQEYHDVLVTV